MTKGRRAFSTAAAESAVAEDSKRRYANWGVEVVPTPAKNPETAKPRLTLWMFVLCGVCLLVPTIASSQERNAFSILRERFGGKSTTEEPEIEPARPVEPKAPAVQETKDNRNAFQVMRERIFGKKPVPEAADGVVLRGGQIEREQRREGVYLEIEGAKKLFQDEKYDDAIKVCEAICKNTKNPAAVVEEALFFKCECQYKKGNYRDAKSNYIKLLRDYRSSARFQPQATQRLFDIANFWLDDTRRQMEQSEDEKRLLVRPASYISFSNSKPFLDIEGHALQALDEVRLNDISGPLGEKSLFYIATVKFFRKDYTNADYYYSQLYENYPNSPLAPKAVKQGIICKQLLAHGCVYDNTAIEEARKLVDTAARAFPEVNGSDDQFLERQLLNISQHQAERDFEIAQFYRRTGHPGSAYFYFELVRRRYPNTKLSEKAMEEMTKIRSTAQQRHAEETAPLPTPAIDGDEPGRLRLPDVINPVSWWKKQ